MSAHTTTTEHAPTPDPRSADEMGALEASVPVTRQAIKLAREAIRDFNLIEEGDRVAVGMSGGKDSAEDLVQRSQAEALDYTIVSGKSHFETIRQSYLAHQLGLGGWSQTVAYGPGAAMGLHVASCMPNLTQPYDMVGPMAWEDTLVNEDFPFEDGCFLVPDRPGLGYTLNYDAVSRYLLKERVLQ